LLIPLKMRPIFELMYVDCHRFFFYAVNIRIILRKKCGE
jgi:hypothetical protein